MSNSAKLRNFCVVGGTLCNKVCKKYGVYKRRGKPDSNAREEAIKSNGAETVAAAQGIAKSPCSPKYFANTFPPKDTPTAYILAYRFARTFSICATSRVSPE